MEANTPFRNEPSNKDQHVVKPESKRQAKKPKDGQEEPAVQFRCGCSKIYVSEGKLFKHIEERHSSVFLEVVKYETIKKSTLHYVQSRQKKNKGFNQNLSKRPPKPEPSSESGQQESDSQEDREYEFILELILQVSKFLEHVREIDSNKTLTQATNSSITAPVVFGNPRKLTNGAASSESKSMMIENFTGQSKAKVV